MIRGKIRRQTALEGLIQKLMREVSDMAPNPNRSVHFAPLFIQAAYNLGNMNGHRTQTDLQQVFREALKQHCKNHLLQKIGLQALVSYYLRKLYSLKESALRYELDIAA